MTQDQAAAQRRWVLIGWGLALLSAALFALRPVLVKLVYAEGVDSTTLIVWRMLFSAPIYILMLTFLLLRQGVRSRVNARVIGGSALVGVLGYFGASYFDLLGLQYVSAQLGRMILYTYPGFVVLFGALIFAEKIKAKTIIALISTYLGVAIIFGHDLAFFGDAVFSGAALITIASLCFALYLLFSKPLVEQLGSRVFTCVALLSASGAIFLFAGMQEGFSFRHIPDTRPLGLIFVIAILCTVVPSFCTAEAISRIGASSTSVASMSGPVVTSIAAVALLGELFTVWHGLGIALVVWGVYWMGRV